MGRKLRGLVAALMVLAACQTVGPRSLRHGRGSYNAAIQQTNNEQLLLNLVRLRYRDAPLFLEVTSVSSSLSMEVGGAVGGAVGGETGSSVSPGTSVTYIDRPTITYVPLQGSRFGKQFLSPLGLADIQLLYHAGWAIDRIFKVFVQRLGSLQNAPRASGPTPMHAPVYEAFFAATDALRALWQDGLVEMEFVSSVAGDALRLKIEPTPAATPHLERLSRALGLREPASQIVLTEAPRPGEANAVRIVTRSLLGGMYYVSHGVEVPPDDVALGRVPLTRDREGRPFEWSRVTDRLLRVRHDKREPMSAYVSVHHRGLWFYIDDNDLDSKATFSFLAQVLEMQSGEIRSAGPVLTLPVAQ